MKCSVYMFVAGLALAARASPPASGPVAPTAPTVPTPTAPSPTAPASAPPSTPEPIPKARAKSSALDPSRPKLPAYLGLFGPASFIRQTGFRSTPGRFIEFANSDAAGRKDGGGALRISEVGPESAGERWLEIVNEAPGVTASTLRIKVRGDEDGNLERIVLKLEGFAPLEVPVDRYEVTPTDPSTPSDPQRPPAMPADARVRNAGREKVTVPVGTFDCDHWILESKGMRHDYWVTRDAKIPFTGAVKITTEAGTMVAAKVGTDAKARFEVPRR